MPIRLYKNITIEGVGSNKIIISCVITFKKQIKQEFHKMIGGKNYDGIRL